MEDVLNWKLSHKQDATVFAPYYRYEPLSAKDIYIKHLPIKSAS